MSWDLQDIGAHLVERHGFNQYHDQLPTSFWGRELEHDQDHASEIGIGHVHDPKDPRIIKEV